MAAILMLLASSPHSPLGARAISLAESLAEAGHTLTLCCLQDAVALGTCLAAEPSGGVLDRLLKGGTRWVVLGEDLRARGLDPPPGASVVDAAEVVALLSADHDRVIGAL